MKHLFPHMSTLILLMVITSSCSNNGNTGPDQRKLLLQELGQFVILPMHKTLADDMAKLATAARAFCATPSLTKLKSTQSAWWRSRRALKHVEVFGFGPYAEEPLRYGPKLDFYPSRASSIESRLNATPPITADSLSSAGAAQRGSPVIEYLLYTPGTHGTVLGAFEQNPRRCAYLIAATEDVKQQALNLHDAWAPEKGNYLGALTNAGVDKRAYTDVSMALSEVANRMVFIIENIRKDKLNKPLGKTAQGTPQPELVESRYANRAKQDILDNLEAVRALFYGDYRDDEHMGFHDVLLAQGTNLSPTFEQLYKETQEAFADIDQPLVIAIIEAPQRVERAYDTLRNLQRFIQTDMLGALGIQSEFNDNDGD